MGVRLLNIFLNGKKTELEKAMTLVDLLEFKNIETDRVIVEYNFGVLMKNEWESTVLKEDDNIEVLKFVGGG
jgi:sulfur carrier protein